MKTSKLLIFIFLVHLFMACTNIRGIYIGQKGALLDKIILKEGHKADIVFLGSITEVPYERTGDKIKFMIPDGAQIFTLDSNGCLDGGSLVGKYCLEEN